MRNVALLVFGVTILLIACIPQKLTTGNSDSSTVYTKPVDYPINQNNMVHQEGQKIVDGKGNTLFLKGVIPLGWLQWEGTIFNAGFVSETKIREKIVGLVGQSELDKFESRIFENFINEKDIIAMRKLGFNAVRVPFNHTILEDDNKPYRYKESGWKIFDRLISDCEKHNLYVILDLQSAPGGQSVLFVADPGSKKLWQDVENQKRTIALWKAIASRYKDKEIVAGYDLLNEPNYPDSDKLITMYIDIIKTIREVDKKHMLFIEGNKLATDFSIFDSPLSHNMSYSFHTYHLLGPDNSRKHFEHIQKISKEQKVPIWNSEFGAHNLNWTKETVQLFNSSSSQNSGWIFWPWKRVPSNNIDRYRHLHEIESTPNWDKLRKYIGFLGKKPSRSEAIQGMNEFVEAMKIENCIVNKEIQGILK